MRTRLLILALAAVVLTGCGTVVRVAYNNADYAARIAAHDWFDLHGEQSALMRTRIEDFHTWHRREELPRYGRLFASAADRVERGLAREDVEWVLANLRERYRAVAEHAVDEVVPVIATFTPANFKALERKLAESNERIAKDHALSLDPARRERNRTRAIVDRFEEWTGALSDEQAALVQAYVRAAPKVMSVMLEDRKRRQRELVEMLETHRTSPDLRARLAAFVLGWETGRGPEYAALARERERQLVQLVMDIDRTLTPRQRTHAVGRLRGYADDWNTLAAQGRKDLPAGTRTAVPAPGRSGG